MRSPLNLRFYSGTEFLQNQRQSGHFIFEPQTRYALPVQDKGATDAQSKKFSYAMPTSLARSATPSNQFNHSSDSLFRPPANFHRHQLLNHSPRGMFQPLTNAHYHAADLSGVEHASIDEAASLAQQGTTTKNLALANIAPYYVRRSLDDFPAAWQTQLLHQDIAAQSVAMTPTMMAEQNLLNNFAAQIATPGLWNFSGADMVPRLIAERFDLSFEIDCGHGVRQRLGTAEPLLEGTLLRRDDHYQVAYHGECFDLPKDGDCLLHAVLLLHSLQSPELCQAFNLYRAIFAGRVPSWVAAQYPHLLSVNAANIAFGRTIHAAVRQTMRIQLAYFVLNRMSGETRNALLETIRGDIHQISMQRQQKPAREKKGKLHHDRPCRHESHRTKMIAQRLSLIKEWVAKSPEEKARTQFAEFARQRGSNKGIHVYINKNGELTVMGKQRLAREDGTRTFRKHTEEDILTWLKKKKDGHAESMIGYADRHHFYAKNFICSVHSYLKKQRSCVNL